MTPPKQAGDEFYDAVHGVVRDMDTAGLNYVKASTVATRLPDDVEFPGTTNTEIGKRLSHMADSGLLEVYNNKPTHGGTVYRITL